MYRTLATVVGAFSIGAIAAGQSTFIVDDNAPNDPGPNNPNLSDPLEDGSVSHPFDRVNEAIDAASNGDTVLILAGTYFDTETINTDGKAITIRGDAGAAATIIDGFASPESTMVIDSGEGPDTIIEDVTFSGGSDTSGGAVEIDGVASPIFRRVVFRLNTTTVDGSAVRLLTANTSAGALATALFEDCIFEDNLSTDMAAGTNIDGTVFTVRSNATFLRCTFRRNEAQQGSAIGAFETTGLRIIECRFEDNTARTDGAIHLAGCTGTEIRLSDFIRNTGNGGAAIFTRGSETLVSRSRIHGNFSNGRGGALLIDSSEITVTNSTFVGNRVNDDGGAVHLRNGANGVFENTTVTANVAADAIGGIFPTSDSNATLLNTIAIDNIDNFGTVADLGGTATGAAFTVSYSLVPTANLPAAAGIGAGVFVDNPDFVRAPDPGTDGVWGTPDDDYGDLRLIPGVSPAIDAGDSASYTGPLADLDAADRSTNDPGVADTGLSYAGPVIDLGAFEVQLAGPDPSCLPDLNGDGVVDGADLGLLLGAWGACN